MNKSKYEISFGPSYIDLIFSVCMVFVFCFIIAVTAISDTTAKKSDIIVEDKYLLTMNWNNDSSYDMDVHLLTPKDVIINFRGRESFEGSLKRDDLGSYNDTIIDVNGITRKVLINREVIHLRNPVTGLYVVNLHFYSNSQKEEIPQNIQIELMQTKDYKIIFRRNIKPDLEIREEMTAFSFFYDASRDEVTSVDDETQTYFVIDQEKALDK